MSRPIFPGFIDNELRQFVYPFVNASSSTAENLVTLLAWADLLDAVPERKNGFLHAFSKRRNDEDEWRRLERELSKKTVTINARPFGTFLFWGGFSLCALFLLELFRTQGLASFHVLQIYSPWRGVAALCAAGVLLTILICIAQTWLAHTGFSLAIAEPERILSLSDPPFGSTKRERFGSYPQPPNPLVYNLDRRFKWLDDGGNHTGIGIVRSNNSLRHSTGSPICRVP